MKEERIYADATTPSGPVPAAVATQADYDSLAQDFEDAVELAQRRKAEVKRLRALLVRLAGLAPRLRLRSPATRAEIQAWAELREEALEGR